MKCNGKDTNCTCKMLLELAEALTQPEGWRESGTGRPQSSELDGTMMQLKMQRATTCEEMHVMPAG